MFRALCIFILILFLILGSGCHNRYALLEKADEALRQNKYSEAIKLYQQHIENRLAIKERAEWENPYFYLLLIGDVQVAEGNFEEALKSYAEAEQRGVPTMLVADRYRYVASTLEIKGEPEKAIELLTKYRDHDPLLFDLMRDRIGKSLILKESQ